METVFLWHMQTQTMPLAIPSPQYLPTWLLGLKVEECRSFLLEGTNV